MVGPRTKAEDDCLKRMVEKDGAENWSLIATGLNGRIGKRCRERWFNHLSPHLKKQPLTEEEDSIIIKAHTRLGNKWSEIAK